LGCTILVKNQQMKQRMEFRFRSAATRCKRRSIEKCSPTLLVAVLGVRHSLPSSRQMWKCDIHNIAALAGGAQAKFIVKHFNLCLPTS